MEQKKLDIMSFYTIYLPWEASLWSFQNFKIDVLLYLSQKQVFGFIQWAIPRCLLVYLIKIALTT